jgi:hypothetical protein
VEIPCGFCAGCGSQPGGFRLGSPPMDAPVMWTLISVAVVVLVGFAIFVLRNDALERKRDIERESAERARLAR